MPLRTKGTITRWLEGAVTLAVRRAIRRWFERTFLSWAERFFFTRSERTFLARTKRLVLARRTIFARARRTIFARTKRPIAAGSERALARWTPGTFGRRPFVPLAVAVVATHAFGEAPALHVARYFESVARVLVSAARPPSGTASFRPVAATLCAQRLGGGLRRFPQLSSRKPLHDRVRLPRLHLLQRRQQLIARRRAKRRRLAADDDRPVGIARGHDQEFDCVGGSRRFSFSMSVVRLRLSRRAACRLLPCVRSSDRRMSDSSIAST